MIYQISGAQELLVKAFLEHNMSLDVKSDHIVVENSQAQTKEKIEEIIKSAGFCPLLSMIPNEKIKITH